MSEFVVEVPPDRIHFDEFKTVVFQSADCVVLSRMIYIPQLLKGLSQVVPFIIDLCYIRYLSDLTDDLTHELILRLQS